MKAQLEELKDADMSVGRKLQQMMAILAKDGRIYKQKVTCDQVLVHPCNRSGSMVNAHDAHFKGQRVLSIGCDASKLASAIAFEVSSCPDTKRKQYTADADLVASSSKKLAPVTETERYLSVSCSHWTAFAKAVKCGACLTEDDEPLTLDSIMAKNGDEVFNGLLQHGWDWQIVTASTEEALPWLPGFMQGCLNTAQQVGSLPTEVEQALSLAWWYDKSGSIEQAILQTQASMPSAAYLEVIGEWVSNYGGGGEFPFVRYVESFAKQTGQGLMLGEDCVSQVAHTIYKFEKTTFPMMRTSFLITQLSAPKQCQKDGFGRLLGPGEAQGAFTHGSNVRGREHTCSSFQNAGKGHKSWL